METEYAGFVVRPGDKLIIALARDISTEERNEIEMGIGAKLPGIQVIAVDGAIGMAVYRSEGNNRRG